MSEQEPPFASDEDFERLLGPFVRTLAPPTSLSPLPFDLNAGVPDPHSLPVEALRAASERALREDPVGALTYGGAQGYAPLREWLAQRGVRAASGLELGRRARDAVFG